MNNRMEKNRVKETDWDKRYREGFYSGVVEPHKLLTKFWSSITGRMAADIAMGTGRDALFLSEKGFFVTGLEHSTEAIKIAKKTMMRKNLTIWPVLGSADYMPYCPASFDCVLVFYFLERKILKEIGALLKKDGILIYETFLKRQNSIDKQRNPNHLLEDGELIGHLRGFEILFYEEIIENNDGRKKIIARAVGKKK